MPKRSAGFSGSHASHYNVLSMMKILVPIHRVLDPEARLDIASDGKEWEIRGQKKVINAYDEVALSMAVSLKEKNECIDVITIGIGQPEDKESLRATLALQADRAIWVASSEVLSNLTIAQIVSAIAKREEVDLILCGKQLADEDTGYLPQMIAGCLHYPQLISVTRLSLSGRQLTVRCDYGHAKADVTVSLPAVVGADLLLCSPRFASLGQILKAKKQPIESLNLENLGINPRVGFTVKAREKTPPRGECQWLSTIEDITDIIRQKMANGFL